jgi:hypothetical protein
MLPPAIQEYQLGVSITPDRAPDLLAIGEMKRAAGVGRLPFPGYPFMVRIDPEHAELVVRSSFVICHRWTSLFGTRTAIRTIWGSGE